MVRTWGEPKLFFADAIGANTIGGVAPNNLGFINPDEYLVLVEGDAYVESGATKTKDQAIVVVAAAAPLPVRCWVIPIGQVGQKLL